MRYTRRNSVDDNYEGTPIKYVVNEEEEIVKGLNKLGENEDIEDEIEIGLTELFSAEEIWFKDKEGNVRLANQLLDGELHNMFFFNRYGVVVADADTNTIWGYAWKDRGTWWGLTKEQPK